MDKKQLWLNLKAYHFDNLVSPDLWHHITEKFGGANASTQAFAGKIASKLGWSNPFAVKAIEEYKKFVYLGIVSDFVVTPPKIIDQVWHEHILFSKAYREFCTEVIHHDFDHNPELVPMTDQTATYNAQYLDTLALYKTEFGVNPPEDIWSVPKFYKTTLSKNGYESKKKESAGGGGNVIDNTPLNYYFPTASHTSSAEMYPEFSGSENKNVNSDPATGSWDNITDSTGASSDSSDTGTDAGSSCSSGCSSCNSS